MSAGETGGGAQVKSAVRTVELLEYFAGRPGMHSLAAVQEAVGYPKSSLYMLLRTLVDLGWVETDATGTRYGIGVRALLVGTSYIDGDEVVAAARPTLDRLSDDTTETTDASRELEKVDCGQLEYDPDAPSGGTFTDYAQLASAGDNTSFDPGVVQTLDEAQITTAMWDGLTDFDFTEKCAPELKGSVAESWESNEDATEWTFKLKEGLTFSNGEPVLPSSFETAWKSPVASLTATMFSIPARSSSVSCSIRVAVRPGML